MAYKNDELEETKDGFGIDFKHDTVINKELLTPRKFPLEHSWKKLIYS